MTLLCGASLFQYNFQKCTGHKGLIAPRKLMFDSTFNLETFLRVPKLKYWPTHSKVHWLFYQFISPKQNKETLCNLCSKIKPGFILTKFQYGNKLPITFLVDFLSSIFIFIFFRYWWMCCRGTFMSSWNLLPQYRRYFYYSPRWFRKGVPMTLGYL